MPSNRASPKEGREEFSEDGPIEEEFSKEEGSPEVGCPPSEEECSCPEESSSEEACSLSEVDESGCGAFEKQDVSSKEGKQKKGKSFWMCFMPLYLSQRLAASKPVSLAKKRPRKNRGHLGGRGLGDFDEVHVLSGPEGGVIEFKAQNAVGIDEGGEGVIGLRGVLGLGVLIELEEGSVFDDRVFAGGVPFKDELSLVAVFGGEIMEGSRAVGSEDEVAHAVFGVLVLPGADEHLREFAGRGSLFRDDMEGDRIAGFDSFFGVCFA